MIIYPTTQMLTYSLLSLEINIWTRAGSSLVINVNNFQKVIFFFLRLVDKMKFRQFCRENHWRTFTASRIMRNPFRIAIFVACVVGKEGRKSFITEVHWSIFLSRWHDNADGVSYHSDISYRPTLEITKLKMPISWMIWIVT